MTQNLDLNLSSSPLLDAYFDSEKASLMFSPHSQGFGKSDTNIALDRCGSFLAPVEQRLLNGAFQESSQSTMKKPSRINKKAQDISRSSSPDGRIVFS